MSLSATRREQVRLRAQCACEFYGITETDAGDQGHRSLLLGAWGCGVFQNDPAMVADAFGQWLESPRFQGCFDRVTFAIYDSSQSQATLKAFQARF
jgi:uncharacterized protein (TIGR02452 family)